MPGQVESMEEVTVSDDKHDGAEAESSEPDPEETSPDGTVGKTRSFTSRRLSISLRGGLIGATIVALAAATAVMSWLYITAEQKLDADARRVQNNARAEKTALDYAVSAAAMNYKDLAGWRVKLVAGTTPELHDKLTKAATDMEQILVPLQWDSTAQPFVAKVRSETAGIYTVDAFVGVLTKTVQAPEGLQSTATYSLTIDSNNNWQISDVGGVGDLLHKK